MTTSSREPLADPGAIVAAYAAHGVEVPELTTFHAGASGTTYAFDVAAQDAVPTWARLRPLVDATGYYPVVCRDEHGTIAEQLEMSETSPSAALSAAAELDVAAWLRERVRNDEEYYGLPEEGEWVDIEPQSGWSVPFDVLTDEPAPGVRILLVPTTRPWEVFAHLAFGDWNECPPPEVHVAMQRSWYERYGAEVVCLAGAVVEMRVARPPTADDTVLDLAREQFVYSGGDLVYQGYGDLKALASGLRGAGYWYFWWD